MFSKAPILMSWIFSFIVFFYLKYVIKFVWVWFSLKIERLSTILKGTTIQNVHIISLLF